MSENNFAFFSIATHLGGAEKSLLSFLKEFRKNNSVIVFVPKDKGPLLDELSSLDIPYIVLPLPSFVLSISKQKTLQSLLLILPALFYIPFYLTHIHKTLNARSWKAIHSTGIKYHILLCILSLFNKEKHFHIHVRDIINFSPIQFFLNRFKNRSNVHFLFNSKVSKASLEPIQAPVIYNGFDPLYFQPGSSPLKANLGLNEKDLLIGVVGVIARWKGQREFLLAAEKVIEQKPHCHFLVVGDEIYDTFSEKGELDYLKNWVEQRDLSQKIHFLNFQKDILSIYQGLDLLVHSSIKPEPFGRVLVESMLCGCPVLASNQGGPLEIIEEGKNGWLYAQGNVAEMIDKILFILSSESTRLEVAAEARKSASRFSLHEYVEKLSKRLQSFPSA